MRHRKPGWSTAVLGSVAALALLAAQAATNLLSDKDTAFVTDAAQGGRAEVALGDLAASRAQNDMVRDFGQRMVKEHGEANTKLLDLAAGKGCTPPAAVGAEQQALIERLKVIDTADFDRTYVDEMVKDHRKDVAAFEKQAKDGDDPDLRRFAEQTLPTLKSHLDAILDLQDSL